MAERLQKLWGRFVEWWKHFTTQQRALIASIAAGLVVALAILGYVVSRPQMVVLSTCDSTSEASQVVELLESNSIEYSTSSDGLTISVNSKDEASAHLVLGSNGIPSDGYSIDSVFDGSFSTTESDKSKKYQLYLEEKIASELIATQDAIDDARVTLSIPDNDGTILSSQEDTYASVILTLNDDLDEASAEGLAEYVATAVGDDTTENVLILDSNSNVLFAGTDEDSSSGTATSQQAIQQKAETDVKSQVSDVMLGSSLYDNVQIGLNLKLDFDTEQVNDTYYYVEDGNTQGYLDSETTYNSETQGGSASVPGTDSNDETTYVIDTDGTTYSTVEEVTKDYLPNQKVTYTEKATGTIVPDESSISVVAMSYVVYDEDTMKANGELDDTTFDEFVAANSDYVQEEVSDDYYSMVANATGISTDNITILAYQVPVFQYSDNAFNITDYLQYILAAVILLMLGFVIFRSTRSAEEEVALEPELSVESLLETTKEDQEALEDIGYQELSETRIAIDKFVNENPEASAALLRNWLETDWD